jgi:peptide deformylase
MAIQPIRLFGDPVLATPSAPVTVFDKELRTLVADLTETMEDAPGAGLAAPQIGVPRMPRRDPHAGSPPSDYGDSNPDARS